MVVRLRAVLALVLVVMTTFLVSCSSPQVKGPLYTDAQLAEIRSYVSTISGDRDRLEALVPLIENSDWNNVRSLIHGPLGELGPRMSRYARKLAPQKVQTSALTTVKDVLDDLSKIDAAADANNLVQAQKSYSAAVRDLDALLNYAPTEAS